MTGRRASALPLLGPDVARIGRPPGGPYPDRAPEELAGGTPEPLGSELVGLLGAEQVRTSALDLVKYASDASPYRRFPQAVVLPRDLTDVRAILGYARSAGIPVCFRAGGTSLNGQGQTGGILIDARRHWAGAAVEEDGATVRARPGTTLGYLGRVLARHGRRIGMDPASAQVATVGGSIANNAGGMRCSVERDAYHMVRSMTLVLASGAVIDTGAPGAEQAFAQAAPELARGLLELRAELLADPELAERVRRKFTIRNTMGYRLVALLDAETPLEIFRRLVVGSEGTLAFIAEAVIETLPLPARTSVSWLYFPTIEAAAPAVAELVGLGAEAVELMVALALVVAAQRIPGTPPWWADLPMDGAALLVEFGAAADDELDDRERGAAALLERGGELLRPPAFTRDRGEIALAWRVREALLGLAGLGRPPGTALISEDVCFPPGRLAEGAADLRALLAEHGFLPGVAGHASLGNLHCHLTPDLANPADRARYAAFIGRLADLVIDKYDGSLKAEHGTGVNMAPFVEREWGPKATELMWRIKRLADPEGLLGPGVVLNHDPEAHLKHLKSMPAIDQEAAACIECGFCDPVCPSRNVTTTPRERIVLRREMARQPAGSALTAALLERYEHEAIETCAADGTCGIACPVGIDTGALIKRFRAAQASERVEAGAVRVARRWAAFEAVARGGLAVAGGAQRAGGARALRALTEATRRLVSAELVPSWPAALPRPAPARLPDTPAAGAAAVYFPACINRIFGVDRDVLGVPEALVAVSARAGRPLWIPPDVRGLCCATPWSSKGYRRGAELMASRIARALWWWTEAGRLPVVVDASSCALGLLRDVPGQLAGPHRERYAAVRVLDAISWLRTDVLPNLPAPRRLARVAVHPTCSVAHLGLGGDLRELAGALADEVVIPPGTTCCGMAGDRGWLHPELPRSALRDEAGDLAGERFDAYLSSNRTCELALREVTGRRYESVGQVLERLTR